MTKKIAMLIVVFPLSLFASGGRREPADEIRATYERIGSEVYLELEAGQKQLSLSLDAPQAINAPRDIQTAEGSDAGWYKVIGSREIRSIYGSQVWLEVVEVKVPDAVCKLSYDHFRKLQEGWDTEAEEAPFSGDEILADLWYQYMKRILGEGAPHIALEQYSDAAWLWDKYGEQMTAAPQTAWMEFIKGSRDEPVSGWIYVGKNNPFPEMLMAY